MSRSSTGIWFLFLWVQVLVVDLDGLDVGYGLLYDICVSIPPLFIAVIPVSLDAYPCQTGSSFHSEFIFLDVFLAFVRGSSVVISDSDSTRQSVKFEGKGGKQKDTLLTIDGYPRSVLIEY